MLEHQLQKFVAVILWQNIKELELFNQLRIQLWLDHPGEWVLIHEREIDFYHCYQDAIKIGYKLFGLEPFLVNQITSPEQIICPPQ